MSHCRPTLLVWLCLPLLLMCACDEADRARGDDVPDDTGTVVETDATTPQPNDTTAPADVDAAVDTHTEPPCKPTPHAVPGAVQLPTLDAAIVLPDGFTVTEQLDGTAVTFDHAGLGAHGWLAEFAVEAPQGADQANGLAVLAVGEAGQLPIVDFSKRFALPGPEWSQDADLGQVSPVRGVRAQMRFSYGEDQPNADLVSMPAAELRDIVVSALAGTSFDSDVDSTRCPTVSVNWYARWRPERGRLLVGGIATCDDALRDSDALRQVFDSVISGNWLAPSGFAPTGVHCQSGDTPEPPARVDVLMVVDNSASMADDHEALSRYLDSLLNTIAEDPWLDVRVGVTTTEAWGVAPERGPEGIEPPDLSHDEYLTPSGLRAPGFVSLDEPDARERILRAIFEDPGCEPAAGEPPVAVGRPHTNLCGDPQERGILSTLVVFDRLALGATPADAAPEPYALRDAASYVAVIFSDEDDAEAVGAPGDSAFDARVSELRAAFVMRSLRPYTFVGDFGGDHGAVCQQSTTDGSFEATSGVVPGLLYIAVAREVGGAEHSICEDSLSPPISQIITGDSPPPRGQIPHIALDAWPVLDSIRVTHNGLEVPRSWSQGWSYNSDTNSLVFNGDQGATHESDIRVGYRTWQPVAR